MKNYSNLTYVYAGRKYTFTAFMYIFNSDNERDGSYLINDDIIIFNYDNTLNLLYLNAELIYVDKYGAIDRYIELQFTYCEILNIMHETTVDGDVTVEKLSQSAKFLHNFYVTEIEIRERKGTEITYRIKLVSQHWLNCIANITYSNYDRLPEEVFDIIRSILGQNDLVIHKDTFDALKSGVKISYTTIDNDNIITAVKYLLHKLYYFLQKDIAMKFLCYNETENRYQIFDVTNSKYINGMSTIILSMFKSLTEIQLQKYPTLLATITRFPNSKQFQSTFEREIYDYDYNHNSFVDCSISSKSMIDFQNQKPTTTELLYEEKFKMYNSTLTYKLSSSYWNNDLNLYGEMAKAMNEDNSLVATVDADILRKPGSYITMNLDRIDTTVSGEDDINKLKDTKNKYKALEGLWYVGKIRHMISPSQQKYQLNVILFRNFVKKLLK